MPFTHIIVCQIRQIKGISESFIFLEIAKEEAEFLGRSGKKYQLSISFPFLIYLHSSHQLDTPLKTPFKLKTVDVVEAFLI